MVLPIAEKELDVAGYIVPLNKLWSLLSLSDALNVIKKIRKPIIAMKPLTQGLLAHDLEGAFKFLLKEARVAAVMVGVSSISEVKQTFLILSRIAGE
jgi:aryl-alcohol dehydrogenase-like predicted oxidoreductase